VTDEPAGSLPGKRRRRRGTRRNRSFGQRLSRASLFVSASAPIFRGAVRLATWLGPERSERALLFVTRRLRPLLKQNRIAAANIAAAFPDKSRAEREEILRGCWENFARVIVEFVFLERLVAGFDPPPPATSRFLVTGVEHFYALRDDGKPAVIFSAHLANWEVLGAIARSFDLKLVLPFRPPRNVHIAEDMLDRRRALMGRLVDTGRGAAMEIAAALGRGEHLGMLIDQRLNTGIAVPFFGRPALTNPLAAKFARQFDCPVHGARAIRLADGRLHLELTPAIDLPRDREGLIDVAAATARMTAIVEGWVREHPEQWFWLHDRWRT
jgi:KDO2-lipid IV(A) lauroyltransferase